MKCTVCNRQFKTSAALKQHQADAGHGVGARTKRVKKTSGINPLPQSGSSTSDIRIRFKRVEWFATIQSNQNSVSGYTYASFSPSDTCVTLKKLSKTFEMYKLHSARLIYKTMSNVTKNGQVVIGVDYNWKTSVNITKEMIMGMPNLCVPIWATDKSITLVVDKLPRFVDAKDTRDKPFMVYMWQTSSKDSTPMDIGDVFLEYDIELWGLDPS